MVLVCLWESLGSRRFQSLFPVCIKFENTKDIFRSIGDDLEEREISVMHKKEGNMAGFGSLRRRGCGDEGPGTEGL